MKRILTLVFFTLTLTLPQAHAGMIATDAGDDRSRVKALLERPEVKAEMLKMGMAPQDAAARVDAMNDAEVHSLAGRLEALPAGGQRISDTNLLLLIILVLVIVILI